MRTTPGLILDSRTYGEADKVLGIFTREFGLVSVVAKGIRLEKSKLRYSTNDYTLGKFALVRGKELWRLTSAVGTYPVVRHEILVRVSMVLRRFLQGEDPNEALFDIVQSLYEFLVNNTSIGSDDSQTLESIVVYRIFHSLGYIGDNDKVSGEILTSELSVGLLADHRGERTILNREVNNAMKESHL